VGILKKRLYEFGIFHVLSGEHWISRAVSVYEIACTRLMDFFAALGPLFFVTSSQLGFPHICIKGSFIFVDGAIARTSHLSKKYNKSH
jgi:hypothetical protein